MKMTKNRDQRAVTLYALKNLVEMLKDPNSADRDADPAEADRQIEVAEQVIGDIEQTMDALGERGHQRSRPRA